MSSNTSGTEKHTFEMSGLGEGPYTLVTAAEASDDTRTGVFWCEHCGTVIKNRYFIKSSTGVYVVGVDCANKSGDQGIIDGIKRLKREEKVNAKAAQRLEAEKQLANSKLTEFKAAHDGKLPSQVAQELEAAYQVKRSAWIDALDAGEYPIVSELKKQGSTFAGSMHLQAYCREPYSNGQASVIKEIIAKMRSGARKNSKAYRAALPTIEMEFEALQVKLQAFNIDRREFEKAIDYANLMKGWES